MRNLRIAAFIAVAMLCAGPIRQASAQQGSELPLTPTSDVFNAYCDQPDASDWFCGPRRATLSSSQQWEIVEAYCFDEVALPRPQAASTRDLRIKALQGSLPGRGNVCASHEQARQPLALEFNHRVSEWSPSNKGFESRSRTIELDPVSRTPTAHLVNGDVVGIIITETNPVLFVANRGDAKEDNIDQVKSLEQLLGLLGSSLGGALLDLRRLTNEFRSQMARLAPLMLLSPKALSDALNNDPALLNRDVTSAATDRQLDAIRQEEEDKRTFLDDLGRLGTWISAAATSIEPTKTKLSELLDHRERLQLVAQQLETGPASLKGLLDQKLEDPHEWSRLFEILDADAKKVPTLLGCEAVIDTFAAVVVAKPENPVDVHAAAIRFRQLLDADGQNAFGATTPPCGTLAYVTLLANAAKTIEADGRKAARNPSDVELARALRESQADARERHLQHALILGRLVRQIGLVKQNLKDTLAKEEETRKAGLVLGVVARRVRDAGIRRVSPNEIVITNRIFVQDEVYSSKWTKVRTTPLKISLNSPYADSVPNDRPKETATSYRFVRRGLDRLTFGVGLLYTSTYSATYIAADPDPSRNETQTTTTTTGGPPPAPIDVTQQVRPELKRIIEKERQPRAGSYALFVNYRVFGSSALGLGGQLGVATSGDNPAFLGGFAISLSPYVTVGLGGGRFRVKRLSEEMEDPSILVGSSDEIRLINKWMPAGYVSVSVNVSGLPLFK